jgi:allantoicase
MSKTKQLLDDVDTIDFYSVYADSTYWYGEWEKVNRERVTTTDTIIINEKKTV